MALNQISLQRLGDRVTKKIGVRKNLIINGAMNVAQRGTTATTSLNGYHTVDRFRHTSTGLDNAPTHEQANIAAGTTPYTLGFRKSYKLTNGNQSSGAGADDRFQTQYSIEAQDLASSGWNYVSSSSFITLSFWCKSSVAQNFFGFIQTDDGTSQSFPFQTGSLTADTWTKITVKVPGNSNIQIDNNNDMGMKILWDLFEGTNLTASGVTLNQWGAFSATAKTPDQTSTWYTTNDSTFELTGVQLEVDNVATDFEFRSLAEELQLCKRYFQVAGGTHWGATEGTTNYRLQVPLEPEMRVAPTVTVRSGHKLNTRDQTDVTITDPTKSATTAKTRNIWTSVTTSGLTTGRPIMGRSQEGDLGDYLACDSEF
tara:strand:+ start:117 stop:1226 length:1110 start_codon:yes stop_codon:yes gene_type:complete